MSNDAIRDLVIIGGGPAGLSAAIYATRAALDAVTIEESAFGGQAATTDLIDNYPGVESVNGAELGMRMQAQAEALGAEFVYDGVESVTYDADTATFTTTGYEGPITSRALILATGAKPRPAGFEGEDTFAGHGVSYCATCDGMFYRDKEVYVVGGGNTACEEAVFLTRFASKVNLIVRKDHLRAVASLAAKVESSDKIEILYQTKIAKLEGGSLPSSITLESAATGETRRIEASEGDFGVFVFVGHLPASSLVADLVDVSSDGGIVCDEHLATRTPGLFCAGDVRDTPLRQVITAAADGAIAATFASQFLSEQS